VQLVIALGGGCAPDDLPFLPGDPLMLGFAPQLELLRRASLTITHAGMNTVLESLAEGVPMVAIPIANDQPGMGARLAWSGSGAVVPPEAPLGPPAARRDRAGAAEAGLPRQCPPAADGDPAFRRRLPSR
jgi:hypothetical protein